MNNQPPKLDLKQCSSLFEGFTLQMIKPGQQRKAKTAVTRVLGSAWQVKAFGDSGTDFEVTSKTKKRYALSAGRAWEKTYRLRAEPGVIYAEPIFTIPVSAPPEFQPEGQLNTRVGAKRSARATAAEGRAAAAVFGTRPLPESDDPSWSIKEVKVLEAWRRFPANKEPGEAVIVGHPDTGYSEHPEIVSRLLVKKGHDYVKDDADAKDDLDSGLLLFPGHGTGTSSVIVSPKDAQGDYGSSNGKPIAVWGVAPGAKLIPLRVSRSVVLDVPWAGSGVLSLARAIELAADRGAHVISMSLGTGFANSRLLKAVQYAQRRGVIVLAAAGNYVPFVVWPAAYSEVIAVAASNARRQTWKYSSFGSAVDVTAPGESVWCAGVTRPAQFSVGRGSGTSFAVATVAGIAALWLSYHGRDKLVQRFGAEKIPIIFNRILRNACDQVPGWKPGFGHGLVNADKVLAAPLDNPATPIPHMASALREHPAIDNGGLATFHHLFETALPKSPGSNGFASMAASDADLWARLAELLNVTEEELPARLKEVGQELAFHLAANPVLYEQFSQCLSRKKRSPTRATRAGKSSPIVMTEDIEAVRSGLLAKSTSKALKVKLSY
ncbi:MAG: S8 family serine peptidase [Pyrinomonadaceae bacterium]